jgi:YbgC/YbaW family acyl-CoA thioester hydrolase
MTLFLRFLHVALRSCFRPRIQDVGQSVEECFRVHPWDLDIFLHMNNAKYLNYMEVARWGFVFRAGFFWHSLRHGWTLPIAKIDIRYLRSLTLGRKFTVSARVVAYTDRWIYIHQTFSSRGKVVSQALVQTTVWRKSGSVPTAEFLSTFGLKADSVSVPPEIEPWLSEFAGRKPSVK